ncbi:hypothetical protein QUF56_12265 [Ureibacillus composti]|nr:hypothetical protein [Ureibacillus composti]
MRKVGTALLFSFLLLFSSVSLDSSEASAAGGTVINTYDDLISPVYKEFTNLTYKELTWVNGFTRTKSSGVQVYSTAKQLLGYSALRYTYSYYTY